MSEHPTAQNPPSADLATLPPRPTVTPPPSLPEGAPPGIPAVIPSPPFGAAERSVPPGVSEPKGPVGPSDPSNDTIWGDVCETSPSTPPTPRPVLYPRCLAGYRKYDPAPKLKMTEGYENSGYEDVEIPHDVLMREDNRFLADPSLIPPGVDDCDMMCGIFEGVYRGYLEVDKSRMVLVKTRLGQAFDRVHAAQTTWGNVGFEHMDLMAKVIVYLEDHHSYRVRVVDQGSGGVPLPDAEFDYKGHRCNLEVECSTIRTRPDQVVKNLLKGRARGVPVLFVVPNENLHGRLLKLFEERVPDAVLGRDFSIFFRDESGFVESHGDLHGELFDLPPPGTERPPGQSPGVRPVPPPDLHEELNRVLRDLLRSAVDEVSPAEIRGRLSPELLRVLPSGERAQLTAIGHALVELKVPNRRGWRGPTRVTLYQLKNWHPVGATRTDAAVAMTGEPFPAKPGKVGKR